MDEILNRPFTNDDARKVHGEFDRKVSGVSNAHIGKIALRAWGYFKDPTVTPEAKMALGAALLYFIVPVDLIPDSTIIFGYLDDMAVLSYALTKVGFAAAALQSVRKRFRKAAETAALPEE